tara:strand:- start:618 stop:1787 length:1170 start_codon:yes stop_codon:yes gene_type:complete
MAKPADFVVANASGANVRTDLNNLFDAISINNGFGSAPTTKYKYMWYADTSSGKMSFYKANASDKLDFISLTDGNFFGPNGSAQNPSYTFTNSTSTGFYRPDANRIGVSNNGAETALFKVDGVDLKGHLNVTTTTGESYIQIKTNNLNNEEAYIDLIADTTYTDYGLRLIREDNGANTNSALSHRGTGDLRIHTQDAGRITFATTNINRWIINDNGALISSHNTETVPSAVNVTGGILPRGIVSKKGGASDAELSANFYNFFWDSPNLVAYVDTSIVGTAATQSSDYRIKQNISLQTESGIDKVKLLKPSNFQFKDYKGVFKADGITREGFIAHEVQEVIPSAVTGTKDGDDIQALNLIPIVSVLTKALQEAVAKIETLEAKVAVLEGG